MTPKISFATVIAELIREGYILTYEPNSNHSPRERFNPCPGNSGGWLNYYGSWWGTWTKKIKPFHAV